MNPSVQFALLASYKSVGVNYRMCGALHSAVCFEHDVHASTWL